MFMYSWFLMNHLFLKASPNCTRAREIRSVRQPSFSHHASLVFNLRHRNTFGTFSDFSGELRRLNKEAASAFVDLLGFVLESNTCFSQAELYQLQQLYAQPPANYADWMVRRAAATTTCSPSSSSSSSSSSSASSMNHVHEACLRIWYLYINMAHVLALLRAQQARLTLRTALVRQLALTRQRTAQLRQYVDGPCVGVMDVTQ